MEEFNREIAIKLGWQQCSIFTKDSSPSLYELLPSEHKLENSFYMVLSHPCSLLNANLISEPTLEYIVCEEVGSLDGNCTFGKNPRILHLAVEGTKLALYQNKRGFIPKSLITTCKPQITNLPFSDESLITRWMANRYTTTALPDEFENRLSKSKSKLSKAFASSLGAKCKTVYIGLNEFIKDLPTESVYECTLVFTLNRDNVEELVAQEDDANSEYNQFKSRIITIFDSIQGVTLNKVLFIGENKLTVEQLESGKLKKWQFDYVSLSKSGQITSYSN